MNPFVLVQLAVLSQAPTQISYETYGARLSNVIPALAALAGQPLKVAPSLAERAVVLRLDQAPIKESLKRLASATWGKWVQEDGSFVLYPDKDRYARALVDDRSERLKTLQKSLARLGRPRKDKDETITPQELALKAMVPEFDISAWVEVPFNRQIVYSDRPTPLQEPLPSGAVGAIREMVVRINETPATDDGPSERTDLSRVAKIDLVVSKVSGDSDSTGLSFRFLLFDAKGSSLGEWQYILTVSDDDPDAGDGTDSTGDAQPSKDAGKPLSVGPICRAFFASQYAGAPVTADLRERLLDPVRYDPVRFTGEALVAYARAKNRQLVASPSDEFGGTGMRYSPKVTDECVEDMLSYEDCVDSGEESGWIELEDVVGEVSPNDSGYSHCNRTALKDALGKIKETTEIDLPMLIKDYRLGLPAIEDQPASLLYTALIEQIRGCDDLVRLLATLDDLDLNDLLAGNKLPLSRLPESFRAAYGQIMASDGLNPVAGDGTGGLADMMQMFGARDSAAVVSDSQQQQLPASVTQAEQTEFTEASSTYLPDNGTVTLLHGRAVALETAIGRGRTEHTTSLPLEAYAAYYAYGRTHSKIRVGTLDCYALRLGYTPILGHLEIGQFTSVPVNAPWMLKTDLPKDQQKIIDDFVAQYRKAMEEYRRQGGTRSGLGP